MEMYRIMTGEYEGRIGTIDKTVPGFKYGNVMFYPIEGQNPYRVCVRFSEVERLEK